MSNMVDILVCDGPLAGLVYCTPRPVSSTLTVYLDGESYSLQIVKYEGRYWVAVIDAEDTSAVAAMIVAKNWQPSWDLLREQGEHP